MNTIVLSIPPCPVCGETIARASVVDEESAPRCRFAKVVSFCPKCNSRLLFGHISGYPISPVDKEDFMFCIAETTIEYVDRGSGLKPLEIRK